MNLTLGFLPPRVRAVVYGVTVIAALVISCAQKGFESIGQAEPMWLGFAGGALAPLAAAVGVLALANVTRAIDEPVDEAPAVPDEAEQARIDSLTGDVDPDPDKVSEFAEEQPVLAA